MSILRRATKMTMNEAINHPNGTPVPTMHLVAYRTAKLGNTTVNYWVAEKLVVGAYASGRQTKMITGTERKVKLNEIHPVAAFMDIVNPFKTSEDDGKPEYLYDQLVIDAKYAKVNKPEKTQPLLTYYLSMKNIELAKTDRVFGVGSYSYTEGKDAVMNEAIESTSFDGKLTAYVEAAGTHGFKFTGVKIFGLRLGGVYKQIIAGETAAIEKAAKSARKDFKRDAKLTKPVAKKAEFVDEKDETQSNDPQNSESKNQSTPSVDPTSENVGKEGAAATAAPETPKAEPVKEEAKVETPKVEEPKKEETPKAEPVKEEAKKETTSIDKLYELLRSEAAKDPKLFQETEKLVTEITELIAAGGNVTDAMTKEETPEAEAKVETPKVEEPKKEETPKAEPVKEEAKKEDTESAKAPEIDMKAILNSTLSNEATYKEAKEFMLAYSSLSKLMVNELIRKYGETSEYVNVFKSIDLSIAQAYTLLVNATEPEDVMVAPSAIERLNYIASTFKTALKTVTPENIEKQQKNIAKKKAKANKKRKK